MKRQRERRRARQEVSDGGAVLRKSWPAQGGALVQRLPWRGPVLAGNGEPVPLPALVTGWVMRGKHVASAWRLRQILKAPGLEAVS